MNAVLALARKDLKFLLRDKFALFWVLAFPLMFALFFGAIFGDDDGGGRGAMSVAVVDEDSSAGSRALIERLAKKDTLRIARTGEGEAAPLEVLSLAAARETVQKGRRVAYLRIPKGYGDNPYAVFGAGAGGGERVALEIGIDPGRRAEAGFLQGVLMEAVFGALQDRLRDKDVLRDDLRTAAAEVERADDLAPPMKLVLHTFFGALDTFIQGFDFDALARAGDGEGDGEGGGMAKPFAVVDVSREAGSRPRTTFDITFPQAIVWGLMSVAMTFAISLVRERVAGTLLRLRMAPIGRAQILAGKALACFLGCLGTMAAVLAFGVLALGVRIGNPALLALATVCTAACFTGLMMTVSVFGKTEAAVAGGSWGLMMPFAMIGGGMIPLIAMPSWLVTASNFSPFKWAILAVEGALWRGFGLADMALPCAVLLGLGGVFFGLGVWIFRKIDG